MVAAGPPGRVEPQEAGLRWRVIYPDVEHAATSSYLRELAASDCSPATVRSYAYALLRWFRFLHERFVRWERAERTDVRAFVEHLRETPNPQRGAPRSDARVVRRAARPTTGHPHRPPPDLRL
jgi:integrase/recombinase XerC